MEINHFKFVPGFFKKTENVVVVQPWGRRAHRELWPRCSHLAMQGGDTARCSPSTFPGMPLYSSFLSFLPDEITFLLISFQTVQ